MKNVIEYGIMICSRILEIYAKVRIELNLYVKTKKIFPHIVSGNILYMHKRYKRCLEENASKNKSYGFGCNVKPFKNYT